MSADTDDPGDPGAGASPGGDGARRLLARARRTPRARRPSPSRTAAQDQAWSGAAADERDPAAVGATLDALITDRAWRRTLDAAGIEPRWADIVGRDIAGHCRPDRLEAGVLVVVAESTAWATQLRLMSRQILARVGDVLGADLVDRMEVRGPAAPDWRHGPLRVLGRGPRDTYG